MPCGVHRVRAHPGQPCGYAPSRRRQTYEEDGAIAKDWGLVDRRIKKKLKDSGALR